MKKNEHGLRIPPGSGRPLFPVEYGHNPVSDVFTMDSSIGKPHSGMCEAVLRQLEPIREVRQAIAILDVARAKLTLLAEIREADMRRRQEDFFNPVRVHGADLARGTTRETERA